MYYFLFLLKFIFNFIVGKINCVEKISRWIKTANSVVFRNCIDSRKSKPK